MTQQQLFVICFGAGTVIHAILVVLVLKLRVPESDPKYSAFLHGLSIGLITFLWQFGNFLVALVWATTGQPASPVAVAGNFIRDCSLICFPLLFSYMCVFGFEIEGGRGSRLLALGARLKYPLWVWTVMGVGVMTAVNAGMDVRFINPNVVSQATLYIMLFYFGLFTAASGIEKRKASASGIAAMVRAHKAAMAAAISAAVLFVLMLGGYAHFPIPFLPYVELAAMMTTVPYAISVAYRLYQFPFMDAFLREVISGALLLMVFVATIALGGFVLPAGLAASWMVACAVILVYSKGPVTRWVERVLLGYDESAEEQEERVGNAIQALTQLDEFNARVSEILARELEAQWVEIGSSSRPDAVHHFDIAGAGMSLSIGPRIRGRHYMSRQLRMARTAALQLAAHHHRLHQQELREHTARAQMRALQAQINPHFLFNTLNVLSNLIHTNPVKAERVTEELAEIFRYALESTRLESVKVEDELRFLESYLEIEKARFEERLAYSFDVDPGIRVLQIPPMILQPLVENAVKHGISPKVEGGKVTVSGHLDGVRVVLGVEDTGVGYRAASRQRGTGIGLTNVRERLDHIYGGSATIKLEEGRNGGTRVELILPEAAGVPS